MDLENETEVPADFLKSDEYQTCKGYEFKNDLAKRFFRHYLISNAAGDYRSQFFSLLHCAWKCDDAEDSLAVEMRKMALKTIDKIVAESDDERNNLKLIKADLLRRSLQFDEVIREFKDGILEDELENDIISFQIELAMKKDSACYTVEDIPKQVTFTLNGELHKKLNLIAQIKGVSFIEVIETMIYEKADEQTLLSLWITYLNKCRGKM